MKRHHHLRAVRLLCATLILFARSVSAQSTIAADTFVDSVGVNVHLHYDGTLYYDSFDLIKNRLLELGVRHVRDGLVDTTWQGYYERHSTLGRSGIKGTFIAPLEVSSDLLRSYPGRMTGSFEAYEAPNEANASGDPQWVSHLRQTLQQLRSMRDLPGLQAFPVYGPSLTTAAAYAELGDITGFIDLANLHNYFAGRNPGTGGWGEGGYGSILWNLQLIRRIAAGKPIVTTETGYQDDPALSESLPEQIIGRYMPRLLLEQFRSGIVRTYIYELADFTFQNGGSSGRYGLLDSGGRPKPAFNAVKSLLTLLADPGPPSRQPDLQYEVRGGSDDVHHMAFAKRDGRYYVALWLERPSYDVAGRRGSAVASEQVTLNLPGDVTPLASHSWQPDGTTQRTALSGGGGLTVSVGDSLTVVEVQTTRTLYAPKGLRVVK